MTTEIEFSEDYSLGTEVVWVPVEWLMKNATASCDYDDFELDYMVRDKSSDTGFGHLVESILKHGFLDRGAIGFRHYGDEGYISEGHHRFAAAILLCLDKVPIAYHGKDWRENGSKVLTAHSNNEQPYGILVEC